MLSSLIRQAAVRSSKYGGSALKLAFPQVRSGSQHTRVMPFVIPHSKAFSTTSSQRETDLEAENTKLKAEIEKLKAQAKKKGFVAMVQENGLPFVLWWVTLYGSSGVGIYYALEAGYIGGGDAIHLIQSLGLDQYIDIEKLNPTYGNIAIAVLMNEILEAVRLPLCIATTPLIKRAFLSATGKNPASSSA
ncbi:hypothetical protein DYB31_005455 [Aphanomyces astaci]|uniref:DUF1279 domain-containing protein n=1 Tax=Aphanomyces astaci TaxID=112090 RepID=A0A397ECY1_APHAT|nr:hypothetical protein DYB31_005455 [Aphanomyces astaci]